MKIHCAQGRLWTPPERYLNKAVKWTQYQPQPAATGTQSGDFFINFLRDLRWGW